MSSDMLTNYPVADGLYRALSRSLDLPREQLLLTPGSDAAAKALFHAYVSPGDAVVSLEPSYAMYGVYAELFRARRMTVTFDELGALDEASLLASVDQGVRLVLLANPNQPTGTLLSQPMLRSLAARAADVGALLAIDEAYFPFSGTTVLPWVEELANLVVIRTLSKAAGLAGLRVGYVAAHEDVIRNLSKVRSVHDINAVALAAAQRIVERPEIVDDYVAEVREGAECLATRARALGLAPLPVTANFMQIRVGCRCTPSELAERLKGLGFLVRAPFAAPFLTDCIRVTLGPPALMARFADALEDALAGGFA